MPELLLEWYEDLYDEKFDLEAQLEANVGDTADAIKRLGDIDKVLGKKEVSSTGDPLFDYWEEQIRRGETPDLEMTLEDLRGRKKNKGRR